MSLAGERFAFTQARRNVNIWQVDLSDPESHVRKAVSSSRVQLDADVSPDGNKVTFTSNRNGFYEVWVSDADGSYAVQLSSFGNRFTGSPHWSPDGKLIAFDSRVDGKANIYVVDPRGGEPRKLEISLSGGNSFPTWSHDGKWIYFVNADDAHDAKVWKVPSSGGAPVQVSKHGALFPRESPDGRYVYFSRNKHLWRVGTDGSEELQVQDMPGLAAQGEAWTLFGSGIYVWCYLEGKQQLVFVDLNTKIIRHVLTTEKPPGTGEGWIGGITLSKDGKWLLFPEADELSSDVAMIENWR